jgi:crotonobetainyl-CoA:carnitine CoA-transferase CaiB-like acyl-CoA transferase
MAAPSRDAGGVPDTAAGPLRGLRIVDLSRVLAGPYVSRLFCDMGADVIKIEPPQGDDARRIAPAHDQYMSAHFTFGNVGKRSMALDLQKPGAAQLVLDLARASDALVENFRPGVLERLGIGWDVLHAANPRLCLLSITGFGSESAHRDRRAYAPIMHALTGILDDQSRYSKQPVVQLNDAHADTNAGLHGAVALLAALRVVAAGGAGQHIELPMYDATLTNYSEVGSNLLPVPDDRTMNPIYQAGRHGAIALAGAARYVWRLLADAHEDLIDPAEPDAEIPEKARLRQAAIERWMDAHETRERLVERLEVAGLAVSPVVTLREALTGPIAQERELLVEVDDRRGGTRRLVRPAARFSAAENRIRGSAPTLGEHGAEVLRDVLGYRAERIEDLRRAGVLLEPDPSEFGRD